jgi:pyruvate-ferredoxin/flavodoxin oxidoreductase
MLMRSDPEAARRLQALAQADADERWRLYEQLARVERTLPHATPGGSQGDASKDAVRSGDGGAGEEDGR